MSIFAHISFEDMMKCMHTLCRFMFRVEYVKYIFKNLKHACSGPDMNCDPHSQYC